MWEFRAKFLINKALTVGETPFKVMPAIYLRPFLAWNILRPPLLTFKIKGEDSVAVTDL
tara:strand:- start:310 stop:486 length:177 start_codon:yes stop_codon:yes gene_type:complete